MDNDELEYLLARCALKDQKAFEQLYEKTASYLNGVAYRVLGSLDESNDVLQEAFIQIWNNSGDYAAAKSAPLTWMASIVRYRAIDKLRAENKHRSRASVETDALENIASQQTEEGQYLQFRLQQQLKDCLGKLNDKFKTSLELAYLQGYTREELAQALETNTNTVKSWLHRGSASLKQCMESQ